MAVGESDSKSVDPRIRRTRLLLQESLARLLTKKKFEEISVQDVTDEATVNRATFYAHYTDKNALLQCMTASRFLSLLEERGVKFSGPCPSALRNLFLGICYMRLQSSECPTDPHMDAAMVAVIRKMVLDGLEKHPWDHSVSRQMVATTVSWALLGAAKEWFSTETRCLPEQIVDGVVELIFRLMPPANANQPSTQAQH
jgi:AcrR family transcriptional regulator